MRGGWERESVNFKIQKKTIQNETEKTQKPNTASVNYRRTSKSLIYIIHNITGIPEGDNKEVIYSFIVLSVTITILSYIKFLSTFSRYTF